MDKHRYPRSIIFDARIVKSSDRYLIYLSKKYQQKFEECCGKEVGALVLIESD